MKSRQVSAKTTVVCDICGENILLEDSKLKHKHFPDGIHIDYFSCEHCGALEKYDEMISRFKRHGISSLEAPFRNAAQNVTKELRDLNAACSEGELADSLKRSAEDSCS